VEKILKVGVVGAGFIGQKHVEMYSKNPNAKVAGIVDFRLDNAEKLAKLCGGKAYSTLKDMLASEKLDAVDVCLPTTLHRDSVVEAIKAGLDVIVEKPFALNLEDVDVMINAAKEKNRRLTVAHVCRFMPEYIYAKSIIESGELGRPLFYGAWRESATPNWSLNNWLHDKKLSGGTVMDLQIHDIDVSNWLLGNPDSFYAQEVMKPGKEGPSHVISNLTYSNGAIATIEAGHLMPQTYPFTTGYRLVLEKGVVECRDGENGEKLIRITTDEGVKYIKCSELPKLVENDAYAEELDHFVSCILNGADFKISVDEARLAVETVRKLIESIDKSQRVK
jgi:predicted dehydrogenase